MKALVAVVIVLLALIVLLIALSVRVVKQYEDGVLFRLGRVVGERGPGLRFITPFVDVLHRISLRIVTMPIQSQGIITRDKINLEIRAILDVTTIEWGVQVTLVELADIVDDRRTWEFLGQGGCGSR